MTNKIGERYGPQTDDIEAFIDRCRTLTVNEAARLEQAYNVARAGIQDAESVIDAEIDSWADWDTDRRIAWDATRGDARTAFSDAADETNGAPAWYAAWDAVSSAAWALSILDLIDTDTFELLTGPWSSVTGWRI